MRPLRPKRPLRPLRGQGPVDPLAQNLARLAVLRKMPPPRRPVPEHPDRIIRRYTRRLERIAADCYAIVASTVIAELRSLQQRADADDDPPDPEGIAKIGKRARDFEAQKVADSLAVARRRLALYGDGIPLGIASEVAREVESWRHRVDVKVFASLGLNPIDPGSKLDVARKLWTQDNADLIVSQPREVADRVAAHVNAMVPAGARWETIAAKLEEEEGISHRRAALIARDQAQKFAADLNRLQQQAAGISAYEWIGAMDNRERPTHVAMEGVIVSWDQEPAIGHAGTPIQCRCVPIPVVSDRDLARVQHFTADELIDRTAALGPTQKQGPDATKEQVRKRAESDVASEIKLSARRRGVART